MRIKVALVGTAVAIAVAGLIACNSAQGPTGPSGSSFATPQPGPVGPKPGQTPGPKPGGPKFPGQPTPKPSPTPTPTPVPTPTPTPTVPCPATLTITSVGTPKFLQAAINNDAVFPQITDNYDNTCVVKDVKIALHLTTPTGFVSTPTDYTDPNLTIGVCGSGVGFSGCSQSGTYSFQSNATGNEIGTTCGDFVFNTAATTVFDPAAPPTAPYSGTYQWDAARTGVGDEWHLKGLQYSIINTSNHPPDTTFECAQIDITTQIVP